MDPTNVVDASELIPWKVTDISLRPFAGHWSMNPSLHFDGETWRCVLRCADYAMPNGVTIRSEGSAPYASTKNAMVIFDPKTWRPTKVHVMNELDGMPRVPRCASRGYEDIRIFRTELNGLQGIAASLHLERNVRPGGSHAPEQVLLSFDEAYNIVAATPIRGTWSGQAQKNWVPFDGVAAPRFLYSIERGVIFDETGPVGDGMKTARPFNARPDNRGGTEIKLIRRVQAVSAGRGAPMSYGGIRGGSQLVKIGDDAWLGIGHEMRFLDRKKFYFHTWFSVDSSGKMLAKSAPHKLAAEGIEFAAGLGIDGDRVAVSFGVDDMFCRIGETKLSAVRETLEPHER